METSIKDLSGIEVVILPDLETLSYKAVALIRERSKECIASRGKFVIALSGGSTPRELYGLLGGFPLRDQVDWSRVHFFWSDERCVPKDDEASNFRMAAEALFSKISVPEGNIHRIKGEKEPEEGAREYEEEIRDFFRTSRYPSFDLFLLGVGEDGHTASLFPGAETLRETERLSLPVYMKGAVLKRITLSLPVLNAAHHILFLVSGRSKAAVVGKILGGKEDREKYPAGLVQPPHGRVTWLIDKEAASQLK
jgi:6-phosphogluconolactonase